MMGKQRSKTVSFTDSVVLFAMGAAMLATGIILVALHAGGVFKGARGPVGEAGPAGASWSSANTTFEAFSIALNSNFTVPVAQTYYDLVDWTDAVDVITYPDVWPGALYQNLSTSTLNLTSGVFVPGTSGIYKFYYPTSGFGYTDDVNLVLTINGYGVSYPEYHTEPLYLRAGDEVSIRVSSPNQPTVVFPGFDPSGLPPTGRLYNIVWAMTKLS